MAEPPEPGPDAIDDFMLIVTAYLSAHRRLLIHLITRDLVERPEPVRASRVLRRQFAGAPTQPRQDGSGLDPATADLLAAMTDEAIDELLGRVEQRLEDRQAAPDERRDVAPACPARRA